MVSGYTEIIFIELFAHVTYEPRNKQFIKKLFENIY